MDLEDSDGAQPSAKASTCGSSQEAARKQNGARTPCGTSASFSPCHPGDGRREACDPPLASRRKARLQKGSDTKLPYLAPRFVTSVSTFC